MFLPAEIVHRCAVCLRRWVGDRSGNVAMMFGLCIAPLMIAIGAGIDLSNQSRVQQKLAGTVDAIALASAREYRDREHRDEIAQRFLDANMTDDYGPGVQVTSLDVNFDDDADEVTVSMQATMPTLMLGVAGIDSVNLSARSKVSYEGHVSEPVSIAMVLDVSGSMSWNGKIYTLRNAATHLLDQLAAADPDDVYVRTGLVTYYSSIRNIVGMDWGIDHTRSVVQGLWANGGTRSTSAVDLAGEWLMGDEELAEHEDQNVHEGEEFDLHRFVIFMTDGDNNYTSDDAATRALCDEIKEDGIEIFTVAFEAPWRGRQLLNYCASSEEHYFDAQDSQEFLAAFTEIAERIESAFLRILE